MNFDPAIAARKAFKQAVESGTLGSDAEVAVEAEETFSASAGAEAKAAYHTLQELGRRHAESALFQEFLIYITWQQVTEETIPLHFQTGLELCNRYLTRFVKATGQEPVSSRQIHALRESFRGGLGLSEEDDHEAEYNKDAFTGGD